MTAIVNGDIPDVTGKSCILNRNLTLVDCGSMFLTKIVMVLPAAGLFPPSEEAILGQRQAVLARRKIPKQTNKEQNQP